MRRLDYALTAITTFWPFRLSCMNACGGEIRAALLGRWTPWKVKSKSARDVAEGTKRFRDRFYDRSGSSPMIFIHS